MTLTLVDGSTCEVAHQFNENRCIVNVNGIYTMADKSPTDGTWDLSPVPAFGDEMVVLKGLVDATKDSLTITEED